MRDILHRLRLSNGVMLDAEREECAAEIEQLREGLDSMIAHNDIQHAEIKRLRRENELLSAAMSSDGAAACGQLQVAEAEIERLRGLLLNVLDMVGDAPIEQLRSEIERVREALGEKNDSKNT